jgi:hypothetical protein
MILRPGEKFVIARGLGDHTDSGTYYVQATVRNARTDELLATVKLTDRGNRRFSSDYQVPWDSSGLGMYILVTTTVYEDSGYTTKSASYTEEFNEYLVDERQPQSTGGGAEIDYKKIRKIFSEEVEKLPEPPEVEVDLQPIYGLLGKILQVCNEITMPEMPDMSGLEKELSTISKQISNLPKPERVNLVPVLTAIADLKSKYDNTIKSALEEVKRIAEDSSKDTSTRLKQISSTLEKTPFRSLTLEVKESDAAEKPKKEEPEEKEVEQPKPKRTPWTRIGLPM